MFLGPGICIFVAAGVTYLLDKLRHEKRHECYRLAALVLLICATGGIVREVALRIKEVKGPGIRTTLQEASQMVGKDGQFVLLNDENASDVFAYYVRRVVAQKVWQNGCIPVEELQGRRLALVVVANRNTKTDADSLFHNFSAGWDSPLTVRWAETARDVLLDNKDSVLIWVCDTQNEIAPLSQ